MIHATTENARLAVAGLSLSVIVDSVDISDRHIIELLYGSLDLKFVGSTVNDEAVAVVLLSLSRKLLSYDWLD